MPGDYFEHGHYVEPGTEHLVFANPEGNCLQGSYRRTRCKRCQSTLDEYRATKDFTKKSRKVHRREAKQMVRNGFATTPDQAQRLMNDAGVTVPFIASLFAASLGEVCPGWCGRTQPDGAYTRHVVTDVGALEFDWRDPDAPLTPENCGPLCRTCNRQKQRRSWAWFMAQQRAMVTMLTRMKPLGPPPKQERLFDL